MAAVEVRHEASTLVQVSSPAVLPILVIKNMTDDEDELLFQPESPPSLTASSVGTPPTPLHSKFVWSAYEPDQAMGKREAEPADTVTAFDSFTLSKPNKTDDATAESHAYGGGEVPVDPDRSFSMASTTVEDGDHAERVAMGLTSSSISARDGPSREINATAQVVKDTTRKTSTNQPREGISRFQLKGGLAGWLHGESGNPVTQAGGTGDQSAVSASLAAPPAAPARPRASVLLGNLRDKMRQTQEQLELKLQALEESSVLSHRATYSEPRPRPSPQPRRSLQPTSRRSLCSDAEICVGFDDFTSTMPIESPNQPHPSNKLFLRRDSRLRFASSNDGFEQPSLRAVKNGVRSRLRSLSFAPRTAKSSLQGTETASSGMSSSALQWDAFPMEECLADPKLAAEFINTVMPGDEWLLTLLYSIEEYETLTTTATTATGDVAPSLDVQITMATTIIDRFLSAPICSRYIELERMGKDARSVVYPYQLPSETSTTAMQPEGLAALIAAQGATLPMDLFDSVYTCVFDKLRGVYDTKFRLTREYTQLLSHMKQQQEQLGDEKTLQHLVLTFDQVIESEWCCTVFWVYLFRTSHHHRLSFILDVKFKLRRLYLATKQIDVAMSPEALQANRTLQHEILLICRRFLDSKIAPVALPTTSPTLVRLKDELQRDVADLEKSVEPDFGLMERMIQKLDAMRMQTRVDFKRMSSERFAGFLTSALYRDFIIHPGSAESTQCTRADDLTQLLRNNRIPFHQTAVSPPRARGLTGFRATREGVGGVVFDQAVATVFTFQRVLESGSGDAVDQQYVHRSLYVSSLEEDASGQELQKKVECFLVPEGIKSTGTTTDAAKRSPVCFNFLAGTGDDTLYGAVWRFAVSDLLMPGDKIGDESKAKCYMQGVCILSRYSLVDSLREYLQSLASGFVTHTLGACNELSMLGDNSCSPAALATARDAFEAHCIRLFNGPTSTVTSDVMDMSFLDLFECLSITNVMRLFSLILQEKKIVLVSSSYSVLLSVGETLRAIVSPLVWSHIYVPVLPMAMKGYLHCPTPFIFGLHSSYVRQCELTKPSDDFAVVNLDRDSVTGGGDVNMPPLRANALREKLTTLCKPQLRARDSIHFSPRQSAECLPMPFPSEALRHVFQRELHDILRHLETFAFRFECADRTVSVVDTSNKARQWPADAARFYSAILQSQAFSTYLGRQSSI